MTEQDQQIALCEWMEWQRVDTSPNRIKLWIHKDCYCHEGDTCKGHDEDGLPEISLDLLQPMELKLIASIPTNQYGKTGLEVYSDALKRVIEDTEHVSSAITARYMTAVATATQRREALLRTLGLWKE